MNIELRLREVMVTEDPGVQVTDAVMSRVGERPVPAHGNAGITHIADARARRRSRFIVVGALLAVAAAAAALWMQSGGSTSPEAPTSVEAVVAESVPAPAPEEPVVLKAPEVAVAPPPASAPAATSAVSYADLPLLLPRVFKDRTPTEELVLQKAVERHPDLVAGPEVEGHDMYLVTLVMRENGSVIDSAARLTGPEEFRDVSAEMQRRLPKVNGLAPGYANRGVHTKLPDGRALRASVVIQYQIVPDDHDLTRSSVKIDELMRARHPELLVSPKSGDSNRVIVLLTADGQIDREKIEQSRAGERPVINPAELQDAYQSARDPDGLSRVVDRMAGLMAGRIATALGISVDQIGLIGSLTVEEGSMVILEDANGVARPDDQRHIFNVLYAWPRREGESAPSMEGAAMVNQFTPKDIQQDLDRMAVQLTLAEALVPDAFTRKNSEAGAPVIALDSAGKVIGAMRVNTIGDELAVSRARIRELQALDPGFGVRPSAFSTETLTNEAGETAQVVFAWLDPPPPQ